MVREKGMAGGYMTGHFAGHNLVYISNCLSTKTILKIDDYDKNRTTDVVGYKIYIPNLRTRKIKELIVATNGENQIKTVMYPSKIIPST